MNMSIETEFPFNLTDIECYILLNRPWIDELSPLYVKDADSKDFQEVPLLRQMTHLFQMIKDKGSLRLTAIGNIPPAAVKELYHLGVPDKFSEKYYKDLYTEGKAFNVSLLKNLALAGKLVRRYKGTLRMAKLGESLSENPQKLMAHILYTFSQKLDISIYDAYEIPFISDDSPLLYIALSKFGDISLPIGFYKDILVNSDEYLKPFAAKYQHGYDSLASCISTRMFKRQMVQLGLVTLEESHNWTKDDDGGIKFTEDKVKKTELFDKLIGVRISSEQAHAQRSGNFS